MTLSGQHRLALMVTTIALLATGVGVAEGSARPPRRAPTSAHMGTDPAPDSEAQQQRRPDTDLRRRGPVTVVAAGDIACPPGSSVTRVQCRQRATAALARRLRPDAVFALGDLAYGAGHLSAFRTSYDRSWGRLKRITYPVPGNHEYETRGARGYYRYFAHRQPGRPGWYARNLGAWRVYFLNSNCDHVNCSAEATWLRRNLEAHRRRCAAVAMHHPRFSSGPHRVARGVPRLYRVAARHRVDMVLSGHDHLYERFTRLGANGRRDRRGPVQFISGLGGRSFYYFHARSPGSRARIADRFGVLRLRLRHGSAAYAFTAINGKALDRGAIRCR